MSDTSVHFEPLVITILNNLEDEIKIVLDASIPNKQQNRAAQKMSADYFFKARNEYMTLRNS